MLQPKKRISNRRYKESMCKQCNHPYIPTDARQLFCSPQHRIDYNNDKRKIEDKPYREFTEIHKKNYNILKVIFNSDNYKKHQVVHETLLTQLGFILEHYHEIEISTLIGNKILFTCDYGLEFIGDENNKIYKIHKK